MRIQDKAESRRGDALNGFLARWRRNAAHAGIVALGLFLVFTALVIVALCVWQGLTGPGRIFAPVR